ncbi:MAG: phage virion morphogenesis protein [Gammaproteobacteria bacterium]|nr:phage virion morphogenesis protein [Gammaproteobacteria bacterium]
MAGDFGQLEAALGGLLAQLEPGARRTLARELAKRLRQSQQRRIAAQLNPDGTPYAPRKPQLRKKQGRIRRQMFAKLRTARFLKTQASAESAVVGFTGQVERMARVHQFGLRARVRRGGPEAQYPTRELLGFSDADRAAIEEMLLDHLAR